MKLDFYRSGVAEMGQMDLKKMILGMICSGLVACGGPVSEDLKVAAHKNVSEGGVSEQSSDLRAKGRRKINPDELPEQDKVAFSNRKADVQKLLSWLPEAHQIFLEAWRVAWDSKGAQVYSVFRHTQGLLLTRFSPNGDLFEVPKPCSGFLVDLEIGRDLRFKSSPVPTHYNLKLLSCGTKSVSHLMRVHRLPEGGLRLEFNPEQLQKGLGQALALLNQRITCDLVGNEEGLLESLTCQNLGQSLDFNRYLEFTHFEYKRGEERLLHVVGAKYRALQDKEGDFSLTVPLQGSILYEERRTPEEVPGPDQGVNSGLGQDGSLVPSPTPSPALQSSALPSAELIELEAD